MIRIIKPGPATTIQDQGRTGHQHLGVPRSGPFDPLAAMAANRCVGNGPDAPLLEATLIGPQIQVEAGTTIAVIGAGIEGTLCERELIPGEPHTSETDGLLKVRSTGHHIRFPIAFRGGIVARSHLGSVSQLPRARLGNPPLREGDEFELGDHARLAPAVMTPPPVSRRLRIISRDPGWQGGVWIVSKDSDRRGVRFEIIEGDRPAGGESDPEPVPTGAVQIPGSGGPIVLGPDGPVTGGYRLLGVVAKADMSVIAQSPPGTKLEVQPISLDTARQTWQDAVRAWTEPST